MISKNFNIKIKGADIKCKVSVPYSNCIRIDFHDESKAIFESGYKCNHLGVTETPIVFMQTIEAVVVDLIEALTKSKVEAIGSGNLNYTPADIELAERWRAFLRGETESIKPKFVQLSMF